VNVTAKTLIFRGVERPLMTVSMAVMEQGFTLRGVASRLMTVSVKVTRKSFIFRGVA